MIEEASEEVQKENNSDQSQPNVNNGASIPDVPLNRNLLNKRNSEKPAELLKRLVFKQDRAYKSAQSFIESVQSEDESASDQEEGGESPY